MMTNEMYTEVLEIYKTLSGKFHFEHFPSKQLPLALKALGMEPPTEETEKRSNEMEPIELKEFLKIIAEQYLDNIVWMNRAMERAFHVFDKDGNGYVDPSELKRVFTKLGEHLKDSEIEDQVRNIPTVVLVFIIVISLFLTLLCVCSFENTTLMETARWWCRSG